MPRDYEMPMTTATSSPLKQMLEREKAATIAAQRQQCCETAEGPIPGESSRHLGLQGYSAQELSLANIDDAMAYQPWHEGQQIQGDAVRDALVAAAKVILRNVPRSPRRTLALQHLISARMDANCAISFGGRF